MIDHYQQSIFDGTEQSMYNQSIELIKTFEEVALQRNPVGYVVGYSGGKDSDVLVDLFRKSGVKFMVMHNHTTLDAPETVYYVRRKFAEWKAQGIPCKIYYPEMSFWSLCLKKKMLPSRIARFCCSELKERDIPELKFATHSFGVRKSESVRGNEKTYPTNTDLKTEQSILITGYMKSYRRVNHCLIWRYRDEIGLGEFKQMKISFHY